MDGLGCLFSSVYSASKPKMHLGDAYEPVAQPGDIKFVNQTSASIEPKASLTHQM
jgi:hypothetical protein